MIERPHRSTINFEIWRTAPAAAKHSLIDLRRCAAEAAKIDKSCAKWEANPEIAHVDPSPLPQALSNFGELLQVKGKAAQKCIDGEKGKPIEPAVHDALQVLVQAATVSGQWKSVLRKLKEDAATVSEVLQEIVPSARDLNHSLREAADLVDPLFTLITRLSVDIEEATQKLMDLRSELETDFRHWGYSDPEGGPDEVFDRVARRLDAGVEIINVRVYCRGTAWNLYMEETRRRRIIEGPDSLPPGEIPHLQGDDDDDDIRAQYLECMKHCFGKLPIESQWLMREYSVGIIELETDRVKRRKDLAEMLDVSGQRVISRVKTIREGLHKCVTDCMRRRGYYNQ